MLLLQRPPRISIVFTPVFQRAVEQHCLVGYICTHVIADRNRKQRRESIVARTSQASTVVDVASCRRVLHLLSPEPLLSSSGSGGHTRLLLRIALVHQKIDGNPCYWLLLEFPPCPTTSLHQHPATTTRRSIQAHQKA